jgi:TRAP-type mannitol/chloroaromatic compound transport system permease small subunit
LKTFVKIVDGISEWSGKIAAWMVGLLIAIIVIEVIARFVFKSPTFWAYDMSYIIGGAAMILGAGYVMKERIHVRVDVLYEMMPVRTQAAVDMAFGLFILLPLLIIAFLKGFDFAATSWARQEQIMTGGYWKPYIYPLKTMVPIGIGILLLQSIATFIRDLYKFQGKEEL